MFGVEAEGVSNSNVIWFTPTQTDLELKHASVLERNTSSLVELSAVLETVTGPKK